MTRQRRRTSATLDYTDAEILAIENSLRPGARRPDYSVLDAETIARIGEQVQQEVDEWAEDMGALLKRAASI